MADYARRINSRDGEKDRDPFEIFPRLIRSSEGEGGTKRGRERCNFGQDDGSVRVYPRATKRPRSLSLPPPPSSLFPEKFVGGNCEPKARRGKYGGKSRLLSIKKINPDRLFPHVPRVSLCSRYKCTGTTRNCITI